MAAERHKSERIKSENSNARRLARRRDWSRHIGQQFFFTPAPGLTFSASANAFLPL
jgi:hypothetical protein